MLLEGGVFSQLHPLRKKRARGALLSRADKFVSQRIKKHKIDAGGKGGGTGCQNKGPHFQKVEPSKSVKSGA